MDCISKVRPSDSQINQLANQVTIAEEMSIENPIGFGELMIRLHGCRHRLRPQKINVRNNFKSIFALT